MTKRRPTGRAPLSHDFLAVDLHGEADLSCSVKVEISEGRMTLTLENFEDGAQYRLAGREQGSGFRTIDHAKGQGSASWAVLGDVCIGHWDLGGGEYLFFFHPPRATLQVGTRNPDFTMVGDLPPNEVYPVEIWFAEDLDGVEVFTSDGSLVRRGQEMVLETPQDDVNREFVFVGQLLPQGFYAGSDIAMAGSDAIARWAPVLGGFVGLWRHGVTDLFFWARLAKPEECDAKP